MTKRPDRAKKLKERKEKEETVIKKSLSKSIIDSDNKHLLVNEIRKRVESYSKRVHLVSLVLNFLVKEIYSKDISKDVLKNLWDVTYVRNILLGTSKCPTIKTILQNYPDLLHNPKDRHTGDGNIYTHGANKIVTNIKNHLIVNTPSLIKKVVYNSIKNKDQSVAALFAINGWKRRKDMVEMEGSTMQIMSQCRTILDLQENEKLDEPWLKKTSSLIKMLDFRVFALRKFTELNIPLQNLLPINRIKAHYITIDTMGFWGLCRDCGFVKHGLYDKSFSEMVQHHWNSVFNLKATKTKTFTGTIDTDGTTVNIHYTRPKNSLKPNDEKLLFKYNPNTDRVLGNDPGRVNIFYMAEKTEDGGERFYRLTRSQYYKESGSDAAIKCSNRWNLLIKDELEQLSNNSPKGVSLNDFIKYLETVISNKESLWKEYLHPRWRQQRFRLYGGKKRVFSTFFNRIETDRPKGKRTVIAYGSAKFKAGGKGEVSVPTSRAFRECSYRFVTVPVDEFRTTRIHNEDNTLLQGVGIMKDGSKQTVRGLLWCCSTNEFGGKLVNRDLNASLNIRRCLVSGRPKELTRSQAKGKLPDLKVVKIIKK